MRNHCKYGLPLRPVSSLRAAIDDRIPIWTALDEDDNQARVTRKVFLLRI